MGIKTKKSTVRENQKPPGIRVEDTDDITKECKKIIMDVLGNKMLGFTDPVRVPGNKLLSTLSGIGASKAEAKYQYSVLPFYFCGYGTFWLAVSLEFVFEQKLFHLINISIFVFKGAVTDNKKSPILRAEWACSSEEITAEHAQPHWHVYPSMINKEIMEAFIAFDEEPEEKVFEPNAFGDNPIQKSETEWDRGAKFHFAMASKWHLEGKNAVNDEIQISRLYHWLDGCLRYIKNQLIYIYQ